MVQKNSFNIRLHQRKKALKKIVPTGLRCARTCAVQYADAINIAQLRVAGQDFEMWVVQQDGCPTHFAVHSIWYGNSTLVANCGLLRALRFIRSR